MAERTRGAPDRLDTAGVDHLIAFGEVHLRRIPRQYAAYYNDVRTHRGLNQDTPVHRAIERIGVVTSRPVLGGIHHQYCRIYFSAHTATHFLMKTLPRVASEMALHVLAYNMTRGDEHHGCPDVNGGDENSQPQNAGLLETRQDRHLSHVLTRPRPIGDMPFVSMHV